jgi:hypothetical protein
MELLVDVTEQPIQRPIQRSMQQPYYSGKKKCHTRKVELMMSTEGQIVSVSRSVPGSGHDFKLRQAADPLPSTARTWADLGYQGLKQ